MALSKPFTFDLCAADDFFKLYLFPDLALQAQVEQGLVGIVSEAPNSNPEPTRNIEELRREWAAPTCNGNIAQYKFKWSCQQCHSHPQAHSPGLFRGVLCTEGMLFCIDCIPRIKNREFRVGSCPFACHNPFDIQYLTCVRYPKLIVEIMTRLTMEQNILDICRQNVYRADRLKRRQEIRNNMEEKMLEDMDISETTNSDLREEDSYYDDLFTPISYTCNYCNMSGFNTNMLLQAHIKIVHKDMREEETRTCPLCRKVSGSLGRANKHVCKRVYVPVLTDYASVLQRHKKHVRWADEQKQ